MSRNRAFQSALLAVAALLTLIANAHATWSIVVVNRATGEVGVACATCLSGLDLERLVPVIRPGYGAAAAQSYVDTSGRNRRLVWDQLALGTDPSQILLLLSQGDPGHQTRQYGIVDLLGRSETFTGTQAGAWAGGLTGQVGEIFYAIQGNVITGQPVVDQAELALVNTPGDLAEKLMAAMEAARAMGGDGRCSCNTTPTGCGSPPASFTHSAYIGFVVVARIGDLAGSCTGTLGCAQGAYYLDLNATGGGPSQPDPVIRLRTMMNQWRQQITARPDHVLSSARPRRAALPADGFSKTSLVIELRDWTGADVVNPSVAIDVRHAAGSAGLGSIGQILYQGSNRWTVDIQAPEDAGLDVFEVRADDGSGAVLLYPFPEIRYDEVPALQADRGAVSATQGGPVVFSLWGKRRLAQREYLLLLSLSGTSPGTPLGGATLPLNFDEATKVSIELLNTPFLMNTYARFASDGRALAAFNPPPGVLVDVIGMSFHFAYTTLFPEDFASNAVGVRIDP